MPVRVHVARRFLLFKDFLQAKLTRIKNALGHCTVLDIGASDGFFALSLKKRGATVTCVDYRPSDLHGFAVMEKITGRVFDYRQSNVYDLSPEQLGQFDIVLFLGVLYQNSS